MILFCCCCLVPQEQGLVLPSFAGVLMFFWRRLDSMELAELCFIKLNLGFTGFYSVELRFTGFYKVLRGFTGFYSVELRFTGFYWVLLGVS